MPTYEYRCRECGNELEVVQSFTDPSLSDCLVCGGPLRKVFSPVGVVLKGSGFYRTDSRTAGNGKGKTKKTADAAAASSSSTSGGSESSTSTSSSSSDASSTSSSSSGRGTAKSA
ncbi:MAG: FmdB family zinc ribbon protein [Acidimicrobiales bacterium]